MLLGFYCDYLVPSIGVVTLQNAVIGLTLHVHLLRMIMLQAANGLGLQAESGKDFCQVTMKFPSDTIPKWVSLFLLILLAFTNRLNRRLGVFC